MPKREMTRRCLLQLCNPRRKWPEYTGWFRASSTGSGDRTGVGHAERKSRRKLQYVYKMSVVTGAEILQAPEISPLIM